ncbi:hypothetical protein PC116_g20226 [Phytophthora cactorum]|nr:hypothetical protein PC114_g22339 [Phytophthora cactorum]KAG4231522.1 hypothetical protein PC116_g20226 [Phytophthora cactorum]
MKSTDTPGRWNRDNDSDQVEEALYTKSSTKFSSRSTGKKQKETAGRTAQIVTVVVVLACRRLVERLSSNMGKIAT